jgi:hypothetical protein
MLRYDFMAVALQSPAAGPKLATESKSTEKGATPDFVGCKRPRDCQSTAPLSHRSHPPGAGA